VLLVVSVASRWGGGCFCGVVGGDSMMGLRGRLSALDMALSLEVEQLVSMVMQ
jgi:hypothetical protein